ncbi:MAG: energy-coupling factor transporter transmembrane protein EcfT [Ruminococcus sp.]|nr:energy-coupling factor transporter transmembrane protein EcfT [Ruminococcus sp.]MCM1381365.1 energy-coupling factor transporter transmembrane protein EcfT [Muribaculaceae bacterium]MCM1480045.1 energy-coupling factor transporter transmembrane protein EcfT [Muribaculaceae bacterium]
MNGILRADIENRGISFDPRTKLIVMLTLVFFSLGGIGSDIKAVQTAAAVLNVVPLALLCTAKQWKKAAVYGIIYAAFELVDILLLPRLEGGLQIFTAVLCMPFLRLMPGLIMGAYIISSTTVSEFIAAMQRMHMPRQITIPLSVMFRFFPTVMEEFSAINTAMKMRDIRVGGKNAGKFFEYRIIPLMVCSVNIGNELSAAALTRGLGGNRRRTNICRIGFRFGDFAVIILSAIPFVLLILGKAGIIA